MENACVQQRQRCRRRQSSMCNAKCTNEWMNQPHTVCPTKSNRHDNNNNKPKSCNIRRNGHSAVWILYYMRLHLSHQIMPKLIFSSWFLEMGILTVCLVDGFKPNRETTNQKNQRSQSSSNNDGRKEITTTKLHIIKAKHNGSLKCRSSSASSSSSSPSNKKKHT